MNDFELFVDQRSEVLLDAFVQTATDDEMIRD